MKFCSWFTLTTLAATSLFAVTVPNSSFENSPGGKVQNWLNTNPTFCQSTDKTAAHGRRSIAIKGNGQNNNYWLSDPLDLKPGQVYKLSFQARYLSGSTGPLLTGPLFANVDRFLISEDWQTLSNVFYVPENQSGDNLRLRFGEWKAKGTFFLDDIKVTQVQPVYHQVEGMSLGEGESVSNKVYTFLAPLESFARNHSRPLHAATATFNSNRWVFGANSQVIYQHDLVARKQLNAKLSVTVNYYRGGKLNVLVSKDAKTWTPLASAQEKTTLDIPLPKSLFPAQKIYVKLEAASAQKVGAKDSDPGSFQINNYTYTATLTGAPASLTGSTVYMEVENKQPKLDISLLSLSECIPGKRNALLAKLTNRGKATVTVTPRATAVQLAENAPGKPCVVSGEPLTLKPGEARTATLPFDLRNTGTWKITIDLTPLASVSFKTTVNHYLDASYGKLLAGIPGTASVWTASSGWKIHPQRALPTARTSAVSLSMAANEAEAAQLVISPEKNLKGVTVTCGDLLSPDGGKIPASMVDILQVYYHNVQVKSDESSLVTLWPDALPPHRSPIDLTKDTNHPFWIRITAPKGTPAGTYAGTITIRDQDGWQEQVAVQAKVFDFTLPDTMTCKTAFGFYPSMLWKYCKPQNEQQKRTMLRKYLTTLSKHHISPYDPAPLDNFSFRLKGLNKHTILWEGNIRKDLNEKFQGKASLHLKDTSTRVEATATCMQRLAVTPHGTRISLAYKTAPNNEAMMSITYRDNKGYRISGGSLDLKFKGTGKWQQKTVELNDFPKNAKCFDITLRATDWIDEGRLTGETWFDAITITQDNQKKPVLEEGFEPIAQDLSKLDIVFDWKRWDKAMHQAFDHYHFNTMRFYVQGLGGGTFHSRIEPTFFGFHENTPEYKILHKKFLGKLQDHMEEHGWLDKIFIYWFDEPDPKDYDFVMNGFRKLKEGAPKIRRALTEQVEEALVGGPNIWCPITSSLDLKSIKPRQDAGDNFWWYVCCVPKAPFVTLFIDHPGTEMRVWLWQTWQHDIKGILVWQTNQWTSPAAYPNPQKPQNPYLDPMSWVTGYSTPAGTKRPWGNGDGRFLYPPQAAANGTATTPILDDPVDSFRIEMLRDGIEDYEYFVILKQLIAQNRHHMSDQQLENYRKLLSVPQDVTVSLTQFTLDPKPMESHRLKLAKAIEELQ